MPKNRTSGEPRKGYETVEQAQTAPYAPTQPALQDIIGEFGRFYNEGVGTELPDFSPVAGLGSTSSAAVNQLLNYTNTGAPGSSQFGDIFSSAMGPTATSGALWSA